MNETHERHNPSTRGGDRDVLRRELATGEVRCTARSSRTGERCKKAAMLGGNVCRSHGGNAPQVKAKAQRRLQQAADSLVQRLLGMALDGDVADHVALAAIRDALDRAGLGAKQAVEVEVSVPPWEELLGDVAHQTKAEFDAQYHPERAVPAKALPPGEIVDAEIVEDAPVSRAERVGERVDGAGQPANPRPHFADRTQPPPAAPPSRELVTLEDAAAEVAQANRRAGVSHKRQKSS